jgi:hypothetical protein
MSSTGARRTRNTGHSHHSRHFAHCAASRQINRQWVRARGNEDNKKEMGRGDSKDAATKEQEDEQNNEIGNSKIKY